MFHCHRAILSFRIGHYFGNVYPTSIDVEVKWNLSIGKRSLETGVRSDKVATKLMTRNLISQSTARTQEFTQWAKQNSTWRIWRFFSQNIVVFGFHSHDPEITIVESNQCINNNVSGSTSRESNFFCPGPQPSAHRSRRPQHTSASCSSLSTNPIKLACYTGLLHPSIRNR